MAPVCTPGRLHLPKLWVLLAVLLYVCFPAVFALIAYDRQTLLNLRPLNHQTPDVRWEPGTFPPLSTDILPLVRHLSFASYRKKRPRRQGKRSGIRERIKAYLKSHEVINHYVILDILRSSPSFQDWSTFRLIRHVGQHAHSVYLLGVGCRPPEVAWSTAIYACWGALIEVIMWLRSGWHCSTPAY